MFIFLDEESFKIIKEVGSGSYAKIYIVESTAKNKLGPVQALKVIFI